MNVNFCFSYQPFSAEDLNELGFETFWSLFHVLNLYFAFLQSVSEGALLVLGHDCFVSVRWTKILS